jgi:hypothetical protein
MLVRRSLLRHSIVQNVELDGDLGKILESTQSISPAKSIRKTGSTTI